jgi:hypothetical protein
VPVGLHVPPVQLVLEHPAEQAMEQYGPGLQPPPVQFLYPPQELQFPGGPVTL